MLPTGWLRKKGLSKNATGTRQGYLYLHQNHRLYDVDVEIKNVDARIDNDDIKINHFDVQLELKKCVLHLRVFLEGST